MLQSQRLVPLLRIPAPRQWYAPLLASVTALLVVAAGFFEYLWPLTWVAFVPLFLALRDASPLRAFLLGWWTEVLITWFGFYWLIGTMVRYGFIPLPLSLLFFTFIGVGYGVRLGLFAWWIRVTSRLPQGWWAHLLLPACTYVALDYFFPRVFPWYLGMTQFRAVPLIQSADLTGVHGITFLLVICSTVCAAFFSPATRPPVAVRWRMSLTLVLLVGGNLAYGAWRLHQIELHMQQAPSLRLALIQPNIGIYEKGRRDRRIAHLQLQTEMSLSTRAQEPDLIIWPETSYPFPVATHTQQLALPAVPAGHQRPYWVVGALRYEPNDSAYHVFNAALLAGPDARVLGWYNKQRLLAFGEYIPLQRYFPFLRNISPTIGNLTPGTGGVLTLPNGVVIGPLICYEDILPALSRRAVRAGANLLINLTNDAWFGRTRAPYLHRMLAAFRAIEHRVYLVRATNTGLTSIIDPLGRERVTLPLYQRHTLVSTVQPLRLSTLYTRLGDWFVLLCSIATLGIPVFCWRREGVRCLLGMR